MNYDKKSGTVSEEYGVPTYTKVQDAIDAVGSTNDSTKIIFVRNGEYNAQISVKNPNISQKQNQYMHLQLVRKQVTLQQRIYVLRIHGNILEMEQSLMNLQKHFIQKLMEQCL